MGARFVTANGLRFAYLEAGPPDGPLALCLHGFPDHAATWRHLLPELADAGFRAVAPWTRGYAPTSFAPDGRYDIHRLADDANALHGALGGGPDAVLIGHDWGAATAYRAAATRPDRWRRVVTAAVPPDPAMERIVTNPRQLRRSWYMAFFQLPGAARAVRRHDLALVDRLWADWSPGYRREPEDVTALRATLSSPGVVEAALSYYRHTLRAAPAERLRGYDPRAGVPVQPTLFLHGVGDGCLGIEVARDGARELAAGSRFVEVEGAGHFLHLEQPATVNQHILDFVTSD